VVPGDGLEPRHGPHRALRLRLGHSARADRVRRVRKFYDYDEHSRVGAKHGEFVTDEICDRFCVLGNAEQATAKLKELEAIGVDQFNIYLMTHGQEEDLAAYGRDIIPSF
jgi:alkanesulfonate monooxygenase SsuD/methylene tetrahydromethanopterin reductase-like flavin-dependent oxidoreductase (luciferase family)